jgi:predicted nucleotidyltransferase
LVDLIRENVEVEMVILFGSYARGDWVEDTAGGYFSDFDVLVVVQKASTVERHKLWSKIENRAQRITKPTVLSLIVHDLEDVKEQLEQGHYSSSPI